MGSMRCPRDPTGRGHSVLVRPTAASQLTRVEPRACPTREPACRPWTHVWIRLHGARVPLRPVDVVVAIRSGVQEACLLLLRSRRLRVDALLNMAYLSSAACTAHTTMGLLWLLAATTF